MNIYPKVRKPFMFWLVQHFLPTETKSVKVKPISNHEFYSIISMIVAALLVLEFIFHGLPF